MISLESISNELNNETKCHSIVRLKTSYWNDKKGIYSKKNITYLRRKCINGNWIEEDVDGIGAEDLFKKIINLDTAKDGIYEIVPCNESRDWESGYIDDWDYELVEYDE